MPKVSDSLWPQTLLIPEIVPSAAKILQNEGEALKELTQGRLYGEAQKSTFPPLDKLRYDFYVGVEGKALRHKLLSIDCGLLFEYPVTLRDYELETEVHLPDENAFKEKLREIFNSDEIKGLIGRLLAAAR